MAARSQSGAYSDSRGKLHIPSHSSDVGVQPVGWEAVAAGPSLAFHVGCIIGNVLYLHGGVEDMNTRSPSNKLHSYDYSTSAWVEISAPGSPALSHHACVVIQNRYIVLIGGWDGKMRTSSVFVFDTETMKWTAQQISGFSDQGGLSSHTATLSGSGQILVIGREGGLHMQRRHGDAYILTCDIEKGTCTYHEYTSSVSSRSGHTTCILGNAAYIIGGRSDQQIERLLRFSPPAWPVMSGPIFSKLSTLLKKLSPLTKVPCGRKNHVALAASDFMFIHGGETFDGRSREPVGEMYILTIKPTVQWFHIQGKCIGRAGHVCCCNGEKMLLHGGLGAKNQVCGDVRELVVE